MNTPWGYPDFDAHEALHFVTDEKSGLRAIIAMHSTHLGPAAGGTRLWHYADDAEALTDALRLSRGMSYKNAMAGLPLGGGKAVVLANQDRTKTPEMLAAFGQAVNSLGGKYVTAEDVGMSVADMIEISKQTKFVAGLPVAGGEVGGDPGPAHLARRVPRHQGGGEARAGQGQSQAASTSRCKARAASPAGLPARPRPRAPNCRSPTSTGRAPRRSPPKPAARSSLRTIFCSWRPTWSARARWARS